ncbi:MAG: hypothetical protein J0L81_16575 [Caulobacterales bacterium]|jgi:quercetin dioxygenase-like cupin family protein|nr:hypothetical protein [Caulobacterales bacterium]
MRVILAGLCFVALAAPAFAQERPATPEALDRVYACAAVNGEAERLACYDAAVGRLREAQTAGNIVAVDRAQAQEIERDAFGFSLPSLPRIFGRGGDEAAAVEVAEMRLEVASVASRRNMPSVFTMTNGQVWVQIDDENARNVRQGGTVTVRRASMGSFLMSVDAGGPAIRVRRQQ